MAFSVKDFDPLKNIPDLSGKVIVVTGATAGLGYATTLQLARKGAKVYLAARNEKKAEEAIEKLKAAGLTPGNGKLIFHKLDLSDPREAKKSAEEFLKRESRLDVLINNASILISTYEMSQFGVQEQMVVNHLSPFIFTETLLPLLEKTSQEENSDVRIVNVSSSAHTYVSDLQFKTKEDLNLSFSDKFFPSAKRYGFSKLANVLWTKELVRRLDEQKSRIICLCVHPGPTLTDGNIATAMKQPWPLSSIALSIMKLVMYTPEQGAYTYSFATSARVVREEPDKYNGAYLNPVGKIGVISKTAQDGQLAMDLWKVSEKVLEEIFMQTSG